MNNENGMIRLAALQLKAPGNSDDATIVAVRTIVPIDL
jgi:hypothetical protein